MKIMISGSHGLIGTELVAALNEQGNDIVRLGRDFSKPIDFSGIDAVVHLAGENIAEGRWTARKKAAIRSSRVEGTAELSKMIAAADHKPKVFISGSAIGFYGERGEDILDEASSGGTGFLPEVCME